jgi:hypothetical protein
VGDSKYKGQYVRKDKGTVKEKVWETEMFQQPSGDGSLSPLEHFKQVEYIRCPDGKRRGIKPRVPLLVNGIPQRIREIVCSGFGNAIVPQVAAEFIISYIETIKDKEFKNE